MTQSAISMEHVTTFINDAETIDKYHTSISEMVLKFKHEQKKSPKIIVLGSNCGVLAKICLDAHVEHVMLIDNIKQSRDVATDLLSKTSHSNYVVYQQSPLHLPTKTTYDMIVATYLGPSLCSSQLIGFHILDLLQRKIVTTKSNDNHYYVIPQQTQMTVRLYHAPYISTKSTSDQLMHRFQIPMFPNSMIPLNKWHVDKGQIVQQLSCVSISDPVEVMYEIFDDPDKVNIYWKSQARLKAYSQTFTNNIIALLEWSVQLSPNTSIGNALRLESMTTPIDLFSRHNAFQFLYFFNNDMHTDFKITHKWTKLELKKIDEPKSTYVTKSLTHDDLKKKSEQLYLKSVYHQH